MKVEVHARKAYLARQERKRRLGETALALPEPISQEVAISPRLFVSETDRAFKTVQLAPEIEAEATVSFIQIPDLDDTKSALRAVIEAGDDMQIHEESILTAMMKRGEVLHTAPIPLKVALTLPEQVGGTVRSVKPDRLWESDEAIIYLRTNSGGGGENSPRVIDGPTQLNLDSTNITDPVTLQYRRARRADLIVIMQKRAA